MDLESDEIMKPELAILNGIISCFESYPKNDIENRGMQNSDIAYKILDNWNQSLFDNIKSLRDSILET